MTVGRDVRLSVKRAVEKMRLGAVERNGVRVVAMDLCREAAKECGLTRREAEIAALRSGMCPSRYERTAAAVGLEGQARLLASCAAVAGCGGLGGWIAEMLARAGVGRMILADGDVFGENNLNRQLFSTELNLGKYKADEAAKRVRRVNSAVCVKAHKVFISDANCASILSGADVVMDGLDNNESRRRVFGFCRSVGIPFIHGAVAGFWGQAAVFFPDARPLWEHEGVPDRGAEADSGTPPFIPPFVAAFQAAEAIKFLSGKGDAPGNTLFWFDLLTRDMRRLKL